MHKFIITLIAIILTSSSFGAVKESWTCYRNGSEFLKMDFDGTSYSASLQGVLDKIELKGKGERPSELTGLEEPFYDSVNYRIKINRSFISKEGPSREMLHTKLSLKRDGYWDCHGNFSDSESLECTVEIERD